VEVPINNKLDVLNREEGEISYSESPINDNDKDPSGELQQVEQTTRDNGQKKEEDAVAYLPMAVVDRIPAIEQQKLTDHQQNEGNGYKDSTEINDTDYAEDTMVMNKMENREGKYK
ncbi:hypothetical protein HAX54_017362, partial [Datura stramonium]|nr:hypothetical protein [Datura stramonium]